jgi:NAD(P)-dependent dehydrogenase (short-subunit alcohol dehydrogenase family)
MAGQVQGKIALVTGGGSGIGRATALALAREGAKVMIADYVPEGGDRTVKMIKEKGGEASFVHADVAITKQVEAMVNKTVETYGRLDLAFNNAGIEGRMADTVASTEENFDHIIAINLKGVWLCLKHEIPQMLKQGGGAIVNTSSGAGALAWRGARKQLRETRCGPCDKNRRARIRPKEHPRQLCLPGAHQHADGRAHDR